MTTTEIRQLELGALAFGQKTYGDDLADAIYLGTYSSIHYFGPVFYDSNKSKQVQSVSLPMQVGNIASCQQSSLNFVLTQTERSLSGGNTFGGT